VSARAATWPNAPGWPPLALRERRPAPAAPSAASGEAPSLLTALLHLLEQQPAC
jgi:hypothetical protein